jgi:hypothetical protein
MLHYGENEISATQNSIYTEHLWFFPLQQSLWNHIPKDIKGLLYKEHLNSVIIIKNTEIIKMEKILNNYFTRMATTHWKRFPISSPQGPQ